MAALHRDEDTGLETEETGADDEDLDSGNGGEAGVDGTDRADGVDGDKRIALTPKQKQQLLFWGSVVVLLLLLTMGVEVGPGKICGRRDMCHHDGPGGIEVCDWRRCHGCALVVAHGNRRGDESGGSGVGEEEWDYACRRGKPHGPRGIFTFPESGDRYEGAFRQGAMHGHGRYDWLASGAWYEGGWIDDVMEGEGELHTTGGAVLRGKFVGGVLHGHGSFEWGHEVGGGGRSNYTGDFVRGLQHGMGTLTYADGSVYVGSFYEGRQHGRGKWRAAAGSAPPLSDIEAGRALLEGSIAGVAAAATSSAAGAAATAGSGGVHRYDGEWKDGKKHGRGTYTFADGHVLDGQFEADLLHGHGVKLGPNSQVLARGEWRAGQLHSEL